MRGLLVALALICGAPAAASAGGDESGASAAEVEAFYRARPGRWQITTRVHVREILIRGTTSPNVLVRGVALAMVAAVQALLAKGHSPAAIAVLVSDGSTAAAGGLLPEMPLSSLPEAFQVPVSSLAIGAMTAPLRTLAGDHLLTLVKRTERGARTPADGRTAARAIVVRQAQMRDFARGIR